VQVDVHLAPPDTLPNYLGMSEFTKQSRTSLQCDKHAVHLQILRLLAEGNPASIAQLTAALQISRDAVEQTLHQFSSIGFDSEGNIVVARWYCQLNPPSGSKVGWQQAEQITKRCLGEI
jgi:hypothetical protein